MGFMAGGSYKRGDTGQAVINPFCRNAREADRVRESSDLG